MKFFLYEFITGGGMWHAGQAPGGSLLREGAAMLAAAIDDFSSLPQALILTTQDARLASRNSCHKSIPVASADAEFVALERLAGAADWTLLIAPETDGALLRRCRWVERCGGNLLSPSSAVVEIASNKQLTADLLSQQGVPVPAGGVWRPSEQPPTHFPLVIKPPDGCGSQGVQLVRSAAEFAAHCRPVSVIRHEVFVRGLPASVAVLCGPAGNVALPACEQRLSADGRFAYLGGRLPLADELDTRARRLALAAVQALPQPRGYIGVDLVLGEADEGSADRVIEINPRLTTSYVGLRAACRTNLAEAMLKVANGEASELCFRQEPITFDADGTIQQD